MVPNQKWGDGGMVGSGRYEFESGDWCAFLNLTEARPALLEIKS